MVQTLIPKSEAEWLEFRKQDITSTEVAALFNLSPYLSEFELWHRKKDGMDSGFEPNDRIKWGQRLQDSIAHGVAEDNGWKVRRMDEYLRVPDLRMGSSFDFSIESCTDDPRIGLLEIKNVDALIFRDQWAVDGDTLEAPSHIEIQVQHQLAVSGRAFAYLAALVGGNRVVLIKRTPDQAIITAIKSKVQAFWKSVDENTPPSPDFHRDAEFISKLYGYAEPGKVFDASSDSEIQTLMERYKALAGQVKTAEDEKDAIKAQILTRVGDAEKVEGSAWSISCGIIGECPVSYVRKAYRNFKPSYRKVKA